MASPAATTTSSSGRGRRPPRPRPRPVGCTPSLRSTWTALIMLIVCNDANNNTQLATVNHAAPSPRAVVSSRLSCPSPGRPPDGGAQASTTSIDDNHSTYGKNTGSSIAAEDALMMTLQFQLATDCHNETMSLSVAMSPSKQLALSKLQHVPANNHKNTHGCPPTGWTTDEASKPTVTALQKQLASPGYCNNTKGPSVVIQDHLQHVQIELQPHQGASRDHQKPMMRTWKPQRTTYHEASPQMTHLESDKHNLWLHHQDVSNTGYPKAAFAQALIHGDRKKHPAKAAAVTSSSRLILQTVAQPPQQCRSQVISSCMVEDNISPKLINLVT